MQKWDYAVLRSQVGGYSVNDQPAQGRNLHEALNSLGQAGWELVSYDDAVRMIAVFKRPKS